MNRTTWILTIIGIIAITSFALVATIISVVVVFIPLVIISYFFCLRFFSSQPPDPEKLLPLYLLALGIQFIHFTEEYLTGFVTKLPQLFGQDPYSIDSWVVFNMVAYAVFILGAIAIYQKRRAYLIIPVFFVIAGVFMNSIAHILLTVYVGGYFPGLLTALIYSVLIPLFVRQFKSAIQD
ncbi:MAG: HXXEE domain-containing protein [Bacteroidia bacterium]|nr:HXXEE domain-containing protein [Bacteroidia bacterium]